MSVVTRFAPSPTGRLHVGNVRTALHNWLLARKHCGRFLLRIDDTDVARSEERFVAAIREDLAWLGLTPDGEERQSARLEHYEAAFERLKAAGRVYPAYETSQELELKRKVQLGRGLPPIYDRAALEMSDAERAAKESAGTAPHWRFKLDHDAAIEWNDGIRGPQHFEPAQMSDPVVRRADGSWLYMLPSTVDDIAMGVTDVLRGEDHVSNTAVQIQMFTALGAVVPRFAHEALLVGVEGKLSKRLGSLGCDALREAGIEPEAVVALLARLGTSEAVEPIVEGARKVKVVSEQGLESRPVLRLVRPVGCARYRHVRSRRSGGAVSGHGFLLVYQPTRLADARFEPNTRAQRRFALLTLELSVTLR